MIVLFGAVMASIPKTAPFGPQMGQNNQNGQNIFFHDTQLKCSMISDEKCKIMIGPFLGQNGPF